MRVYRAQHNAVVPVDDADLTRTFANPEQTEWHGRDEWGEAVTYYADEKKAWDELLSQTQISLSRAEEEFGRCVDALKAAGSRVAGASDDAATALANFHHSEVFRAAIAESMANYEAGNYHSIDDVIATLKRQAASRGDTPDA